MSNDSALSSLSRSRDESSFFFAHLPEFPLAVQFSEYLLRREKNLKASAELRRWIHV
jgi:hypothetical protein